MVNDTAICNVCNDLFRFDYGKICHETSLNICGDCIFNYFEKEVEDFQEEECVCLYQEQFYKAIEAVISRLRDDLVHWEELLGKQYSCTDEYSSSEDADIRED